MTDHRVTLVLDESAIVAYTRRESALRLALPRRCRLWPTRICSMCLSGTRRRWSSPMAKPCGAMAAMAEVTGRVDAASAALAAIDFGANVLTRTPGIYAGIGKPGLVIEIPA